MRQSPYVAFASGFVAGLLNLTAGVSGPLIDTVFVRTGLNRHQIVATKAAIQVFNHVAKITVYGPLLRRNQTATSCRQCGCLP